MDSVNLANLVNFVSYSSIDFAFFLGGYFFGTPCTLFHNDLYLFRFIVWQRVYVVTGQNTLVLLANATTTTAGQKFHSGKNQRTGITCTFIAV